MSQTNDERDMVILIPGFRARWLLLKAAWRNFHNCVRLFFFWWLI